VIKSGERRVDHAFPGHRFSRLALLGLNRCCHCSIGFRITSAQAVPRGVTTDLLTQLRSGGLVLYFRHFDTQGADAPDVTPGDCTTQRNLSEPGRTNAREVGPPSKQIVRAKGRWKGL
jgi:hypothetical protein